MLGDWTEALAVWLQEMQLRVSSPLKLESVVAACVLFGPASLRGHVPKHSPAVTRSFALSNYLY